MSRETDLLVVWACKTLTSLLSYSDLLEYYKNKCFKISYITNNRANNKCADQTAQLYRLAFTYVACMQRSQVSSQLGSFQTANPSYLLHVFKWFERNVVHFWTIRYNAYLQLNATFFSINISTWYLNCIANCQDWCSINWWLDFYNSFFIFCRNVGKESRLSVSPSRKSLLEIFAECDPKRSPKLSPRRKSFGIKPPWEHENIKPEHMGSPENMNQRISDV